MAILAVHIPNRVTGRKYPFMDAAVNVIQKWNGPPGILIGDTNSGRIGIDEETQAFTAFEDHWLAKIAALGWQDAFRTLHCQKRGECLCFLIYAYPTSLANNSLLAESN